MKKRRKSLRPNGFRASKILAVPRGRVPEPPAAPHAKLPPNAGAGIPISVPPPSKPPLKREVARRSRDGGFLCSNPSLRPRQERRNPQSPSLAATAPFSRELGRGRPAAPHAKLPPNAGAGIPISVPPPSKLPLKREVARRSRDGGFLCSHPSPRPRQERRNPQSPPLAATAPFSRELGRGRPRHALP